MTKVPKVLHGLEFGVLLQRHFDNPAVRPPKNKQDRPIWTPETFGPAVGRTARVVRLWLKGERIPEDIATIERILFGRDPARFVAEIAEMRDVVRRCRYRRTENEPLPQKRSELSHPVVYSDPNAELAVLTYRDIDVLPVDTDWQFSEVTYGEGAQKIAVPGNGLFWLPSAHSMIDDDGNRRPLTALFSYDAASSQPLSTAEIYFPRRILVCGAKRRNAVVRLYACTDQPYHNDDLMDDPEGFECEALLGVGGIAAFLNRDGSFRERSETEMGNGLGCAVALVAVAYVGRIARYRTPYCALIRKGIRYPDDVWISPATGQPVFSPAEYPQRRFLFQSRESKGGSTDMFAANLNGTMMVNLNEGDETAWDGFVDEEGYDLVTWSDNRITFASRVTGKGFPEKITREDRP